MIENAEITKEKFDAIQGKLSELKTVNQKLDSTNYTLKRVIGDVFEKVTLFIMFLRVIIYVTSIAGSWFYLENKILAVGIASSLTTAHLLIIIKDWINVKKNEVLGKY